MKVRWWFASAVFVAALCVVLVCSDGRSHWEGLLGSGGFLLQHRSGRLIVSFEYYGRNDRPGPILVYEDGKAAPVPMHCFPGSPPSYSVEGQPLPTSAVVLYDPKTKGITVLADGWDTGLMKDPDAFKGFLKKLLEPEGYEFQ